MLHLVLLALVIAAMAVLVIFGEGEKIAGLEPSLFASLVSASAFGVLALGWGASEFRANGARPRATRRCGC